MSVLIDWMQSWTSGGKYAIVFFPLITICILYASLKIVKHSEVIVFRTKIGSSFFGGVLIGLITSLPELITEITQANANTPENGLGDDIGSNSFSIFLIAIGAIIFIKYKFLNELKMWTQISIIISFVMSLLLSIFLIIGKDVNLKSIGIMPMIFFIIYLFTIYFSYKYGDDDEKLHGDIIQNKSLKSSIALFSIWALIVVGLAIMLNVNVSAFQKGVNLKTDSIGGVFLAMSTSLPEIVMFFAFLKKKKPTIGISSIIGSHFFNLGILFIGDLVYNQGPSFDKIEMQQHLPLIILTMIMLLFLIIHFTFAKKWPNVFKNKNWYLIIPFIIVLCYIVGWPMILLLN